MPVLTPASSATIRIVVPAKPSRAITTAAARQICSRLIGPIPSFGTTAPSFDSLPVRARRLDWIELVEATTQPATSGCYRLSKRPIRVVELVAYASLRAYSRISSDRFAKVQLPSIGAIRQSAHIPEGTEDEHRASQHRPRRRLCRRRHDVR